MFSPGLSKLTAGACRVPVSALTSRPTPRREEATCHRPSTTTARPAQPPHHAGARRRHGRSRARRLEPAAARPPDTGEQSALACVLSPEMTEGPYYLTGEKVRRNITEGLPGAPLALRLTVLDASTCKPIKGAAVDIWHASAGGQVLGRGGQRHRRTHLPARNPAHRREGARALQDGLPRLVPGPRGAHPRQGARRRRRRPHRPAVLPRQLHRRRLQARALQGARRAQTCATPTTRSTAAAAAARCSRMRTAGKGYVGVDQHGRPPQLSATPGWRRRAGCRPSRTRPRARADG